MEAAHLQLSRQPSQLAGGFAATELAGEQERQAGEEEGGQEEGRGKKRRGPNAQHAKLPRSGERSLSAYVFSSWMPQP